MILKSGQFQSKTFQVDFIRENESACIIRKDNETDFLKMYSHDELTELRDLLWRLEYDKLLVKEDKL